MIKTLYFNSMFHSLDFLDIFLLQPNLITPFDSAFDPNGMLRRTDSKESNCSTMTSMSHREDLRQTLSVPVSAFHVSTKIFCLLNTSNQYFGANDLKKIIIKM